mmetsp:Transcript_18462/g.31449  ORF Transcript_18462/g.31449 Transcript_18462/m.31449 type:complete len:218 (+) Transcript_18462:38-691(+)
MNNQQILVALFFTFVLCSFADQMYSSTLYCNTPCYNNDECYSYLCSQCEIPQGSSRGTCVPGADCGATCIEDTDCNQLSPCSVCTDGVCGAATEGCGFACHSNEDCTSERCSYCHWPGVCVPGGECNSRCEFDSDCNRLSNCNSCINNECVSPCGQQCEHNDQCEFGCKLCWAGVCVTDPPVNPPSTGGGGCDDADEDTFLEVIVRVPKSAACYNNN